MCRNAQAVEVLATKKRQEQAQTYELSCLA
jgi:hypothetical protein